MTFPTTKGDGGPTLDPDCVVEFTGMIALTFVRAILLNEET